MLGMQRGQVKRKLEYEMRNSLQRLDDKDTKSAIEDLIKAIGTVIDDNNNAIGQEVDRLYEQTRREIARHHLER